MIQKWYNRIMWIAGGAYLVGWLVGMPLVGTIGAEGILANVVGALIVTGGIIGTSLIIIGSFTGHFSGWVNSNKSECKG